MEPKPSKLRHEQKQETIEQTGAQETARTFSSVEEMLREDAATNGPPPALAHRVADSIAREPKPVRSWWQRIFSRRSSNP
jgi:hypothetical protein